jgi:hypothetical protein
MSIITFEGNTAAQLYEEGLYQFRVSGRKEASRNGPVMVLPDIALFTLNSPRHRVLDDAMRNANPFFHMMEFIWMMAGRADVAWLMQFNKRMNEYADDGRLWAAYGDRWRNWFAMDQVQAVIERLRKDKTTRQAVIQMWSPDPDLSNIWKDKACNTSIMFRNNAGALDMLVTNRSNDFVWGALGANIVHMTMLHELIAHLSGIPLGKYSVVSNNLHIYENMPRSVEIQNTLVAGEIYDNCEPLPLFGKDEEYGGFVTDCENFCNNRMAGLYAPGFLSQTAYLAYTAWFKRHDDTRYALQLIDNMKHHDWRIACQNWFKRNVKGAEKCMEKK